MFLDLLLEYFSDRKILRLSHVNRSKSLIALPNLERSYFQVITLYYYSWEYSDYGGVWTIDLIKSYFNYSSYITSISGGKASFVLIIVVLNHSTKRRLINKIWMLSRKTTPSSNGKTLPLSSQTDSQVQEQTLRQITFQVWNHVHTLNQSLNLRQKKMYSLRIDKLSIFPSLYRRIIYTLRRRMVQ